MNKIIRFLQIYLLIGFPFVLACMVWQTFYKGGEGFIWTLFAFNTMFWFLMLIVFLVLLVVSPKAREKTIVHLAHLKERDEREEYITGKAARKVYISTLSLTLLLLFLSIFKLQISHIKPTEANKHSLSVSIGCSFNLLDQSKESMPHKPAGEVLFESEEYSLSKFSMILILLIWQLASFHLYARSLTNK